MATILITGANGFLGRELVEYYSQTSHTIIPASRQILDISDTTAVDEFFAHNHIDFVWHTAVKYGSRLESFTTNMNMFYNLKRHSGDYTAMVSFGSGAAFDRATPITEAQEAEVLLGYPDDHYGLAKNIIAREIVAHNSNIINLRLFGCFGPHENSTRFITSALERAAAGLPVIVDQNKEMDFCYVGDIIKVLDFIIEGRIMNHIDINMCYEKKWTLEKIAQFINSLIDSHKDVTIKNIAPGVSYTGCAKRLATLDIELTGLQGGIVEMLKRKRICLNYKLF
jgi:GDP-L-fucose synthase